MRPLPDQLHLDRGPGQGGGDAGHAGAHRAGQTLGVGDGDGEEPHQGRQLSRPGEGLHGVSGVRPAGGFISDLLAGLPPLQLHHGLSLTYRLKLQSRNIILLTNQIKSLFSIEDWKVFDRLLIIRPLI